ncbi:MAG: glycosyltransferase family 1 protein [Rhodopila sp.]|jgi:glycosyltransferase involved in cell wall biosynthesis
MSRTLLVNGRFFSQPLSGVQRFATEITTALRRRYPDEVTVLVPRGARTGAPFVKIVGRRGGQVWEQFELPRHIASGMLINLGNTAPLLLSLQVVVIHDAGVFATPDAYSWQFRMWYKFAQRRFVHGGACVVTVSEFGRSELVRYLGARPETIGIVSEGADHMASIAADDSVIARLPPGRFVLTVGNLAAHKNLSSLSELAGRLAGRGESLVVTGSLPAGAYQRVGPEALPQPACYVGRVTDGQLKALYENAACLVFPSHYEGFGLPAVEAMACGCPVVASRIPSLQETCGEAAVYIDPNSPADIAARVCQVLDDTSLQAAMRENAKTRAGTFTWDRAARQLGDIVARYQTQRPTRGD